MPFRSLSSIIGKWWIRAVVIVASTASTLIREQGGGRSSLFQCREYCRPPIRHAARYLPQTARQSACELLLCLSPREATPAYRRDSFSGSGIRGDADHLAQGTHYRLLDCLLGAHCPLAR
jgi:hypothetical protein